MRPGAAVAAEALRAVGLVFPCKPPRPEFEGIIGGDDGELDVAGHDLGGLAIALGTKSPIL